MKNARKDECMCKYKNIFLILKSFKSNWLFKAKITAVYWGVYNIYKSKIYDNSSTKDRNKEIAIYYRKVLCSWWSHLKVDHEKLKMYVVNPRAQASKLQPIEQEEFIASPAPQRWQSILLSALAD